MEGVTFWTSELWSHYGERCPISSLKRSFPLSSFCSDSRSFYISTFWLSLYLPFISTCHFHYPPFFLYFRGKISSVFGFSGKVGAVWWGLCACWHIAVFSALTPQAGLKPFLNYIQREATRCKVWYLHKPHWLRLVAWEESSLKIMEMTQEIFPLVEVQVTFHCCAFSFL